MTERVFLEQLDNSLRVLPKKERRTYVAYYREMIRDRMEDGWSESEAVDSLGDIDVIVGRLCAAYPEVREIEEHRGGHRVAAARSGAADRPALRQVHPRAVLSGS